MSEALIGTLRVQIFQFFLHAVSNKTYLVGSSCVQPCLQVFSLVNFFPSDLHILLKATWDKRHIYTYICIYICTYICIHIYVHIFIYVQIYTCACKFIYTYILNHLDRSTPKMRWVTVGVCCHLEHRKNHFLALFRVRRTGWGSKRRRRASPPWMILCGFSSTSRPTPKRMASFQNEYIWFMFSHRFSNT